MPTHDPSRRITRGKESRAQHSLEKFHQDAGYLHENRVELALNTSSPNRWPFTKRRSFLHFRTSSDNHKFVIFENIIE